MRVFRRVSGGLVVVFLLSIALVATALLAWQAYDSAAAHRRATEAVLRDYSGLAAAEVIRRVTVEVGYQGHYLLVQALADPSVGPGRLLTSSDPGTRRAGRLVRRTFTASLASHTVALSGASDPSVATWLAERLLPPAGRLPFVVLQGEVEGEQRMFVLAAPREGRLAGYEVASDALAAFIGAAIEREALLPPSLGRGRVSNASLSISVRDPAGRVVYGRPGSAPSPLSVRLPFGDAYSSVLEGFTVDVAIDPAASQDLVIGGLPASRLPMVLALLALAAGLLVAALLQLRRERALEAMRTDFVASASHELRTPLTQIRMFAETLRLGRVRSEAERAHSLEIIDRESQRLARLVDNLLLFSRLGRRGPVLASETQDGAPIVRRVIESFRPVAAAAGARIVEQVAEGSLIRVDPDGWGQILLNLLDNAVKYGPTGQEIRVTLESVGEKVRLTVEDQGPGIPAEERQRVFERFYRLDRDRASAVAGTGIGLAVVRELAMLQGGRCVAESAEAGGARMVVELPRVRP